MQQWNLLIPAVFSLAAVGCAGLPDEEAQAKEKEKGTDSATDNPADGEQETSLFGRGLNLLTEGTEALTGAADKTTEAANQLTKSATDATKNLIGPILVAGQNVMDVQATLETLGEGTLIKMGKVSENSRRQLETLQAQPKQFQSELKRQLGTNTAQEFRKLTPEQTTDLLNAVPVVQQ